MSYGFHRLAPNADPAKARKRLIDIMFGELKPPTFTQVAPPVVLPVEPPRVADTLLDSRAAGYSGDTCSHCQGSRLRWAGHCQVCEDCGTTTGCS